MFNITPRLLIHWSMPNTYPLQSLYVLNFPYVTSEATPTKLRQLSKMIKRIIESYFTFYLKLNECRYCILIPYPLNNTSYAFWVKLFLAYFHIVYRKFISAEIFWGNIVTVESFYSSSACFSEVSSFQTWPDGNWYCRTDSSFISVEYPGSWGTA